MDIICATYINQKIIALSDVIPYLYIINILKGDIIKKVRCPEAINLKGGLFSGLYAEGEKIALVPQCAKKLWIYDLKSDIWKYVSLSEYIDDSNECKFLGGKLISGTLYMFGYNYEGILAIDIYTYHLHEVLRSEDRERGLSGISSVDVNGKIYIPMRKRNSVICIDSSTSEYMLKVAELGEGIPNDGITYADDSFYVLKNSHNILYKIDSDFSEVHKLIFDGFFDTDENYFAGIVCIDNKVIFFGAHSLSYIYDLKGGNSRIIKESYNYLKNVDNSKLIACKKGKVIWCDPELQVLQEFTIELDKDEILNIFSAKNTENVISYENEWFDLSNIIDLIKVN